jgi:MoxR-like ATPase
MKQNIELELELAIERTNVISDNECVTTLLAVGEPGSGKSFLLKTLSTIFCGKYSDENIEFYQCHSGTQPQHLIFDIDVVGIINKIAGESDSTSISKGILVKAIQKSQTQKVVLMIDELDKASREVDAFLLDFLQEFRIMDPIHGNIYGNKKNCIILITSNDERTFMDAIYRRVQTLDVPYPSNDELLNRLSKMHNDLDVTCAKKLIKYFDKIRNIEELSYKPTISEMSRILLDWKHIKERNDKNQIIIFRISPDIEDRKYLIANKIYFDGN